MIFCELISSKPPPVTILPAGQVTVAKPALPLIAGIVV
jgi:hypothetical protein